ncbi:MAG: hypothetical protein R3258_07460 [Acidimicrobiia bacterium]|nr:hypothetical protein [Acidimicrobiia bacterium]
MRRLADTPEPERSSGFDRFARDFEPRLRQALTATLGPELGLEAASRNY